MAGDVLDRILRPLRTGAVTSRYPEAPVVLSEAIRGMPELDAARCDGSAACATACPTRAITVEDGRWTLDTGACVFCGACARACPTQAIRLGRRVELAVLDPGDLRVTRAIEGPR